MAPGRTTRRNQRGKDGQARSTAPATAAAGPDQNDVALSSELFLEPMMGTPLSMYIEKDVENRDALVELVTRNGGLVAPGYSGVPYILVDPKKESGQNLYRQYVGKKAKIVLDARWVEECVKAGALQTYQTNFAGCKLTGNERVSNEASNSGTSARQTTQPPARLDDYTEIQPEQTMAAHPQMLTAPGMTPAPSEAMVQPPGAFPFGVYAPAPLHPASRPLQAPAAAPPQSWQAPNGISPHQTHMGAHQAPMLARPPAYGEQRWDGYQQPATSGSLVPPQAPGYDYRYRDEQAPWVGPSGAYYEQPYEQGYQDAASYMNEAGPSQTDASALADEDSDKPRGRKRARTQPAPAPPASTLVLNRRNPHARSPTPPTRVIKSTYGGNLFTSDDVMYLKKYIDYCQEQGLVLSLREICERIAVKAPHHTFYSWRRYCNKHGIRLGGYAMDNGRSPSPEQEGEQDETQSQEPEMQDDQAPRNGVGPAAIIAARQRAQAEALLQRDRSPTPPRALYRSTTGKGVAFTEEDVFFLARSLAYRKAQGRMDMVAFWKGVAAKAPHHSRASWMKFWRRHKHELEHTDGDEPLPQPPEKKMRYSKDDDILLARYFATKPEGTSDKVFQAFARQHPHHPWKGWQEHHRIHKAKIDHLIHRLANGENPENQ